MRKVILFILAMVVSVATCSQNGGKRIQGNIIPGDGQPFEIKQSILFADGSLDEYTESGWVVLQGNILFEQLRYSASGTLIQKTELFYDDSRVNVREKQVRDFDNQLTSHVTYQYRNGYLWRESIMERNGAEPVPVSTNEYAYDGNGNRISRIIRGRGDIKLAETVYIYDAGGNMVASETKDPANRVISSTRYVYNTQGNLVNQHVFNSEGALITVINAVWQNGLELKNEMSAADGTVQLRVTNEYSRNGELLKKTIENFQGKSTQIVQYEYGVRIREQG